MKKKAWKILHTAIITSFILEILYSSVMVFFMVGGQKGPLFGTIVETPVEIILQRRLYAIEAWIAIGALSIYLGLTVILPHALREHKLFLNRH